MFVQVGTGSQILVMTLLIFALALLSGTFHPYSRGALLSSIIVLYAITAGAHAHRACTQD
jgi:transmembrane 9 superfamily member 1